MTLSKYIAQSSSKRTALEKLRDCPWFSFNFYGCEASKWNELSRTCWRRAEAVAVDYRSIIWYREGPKEVLPNGGGIQPLVGHAHAVWNRKFEEHAVDFAGLFGLFHGLQKRRFALQRA
jgi:hypothetical protein